MAAKALLGSATLIAAVLSLSACVGSSRNTSPPSTSAPTSSTSSPTTVAPPAPSSPSQGLSQQNGYWAQSIDRQKEVPPLPLVPIFGRPH
jgi:ABC-type oligopeptide transport system substrate-binding subunit